MITTKKDVKDLTVEGVPALQAELLAGADLSRRQRWILERVLLDMVKNEGGAVDCEEITATVTPRRVHLSVLFLAGVQFRDAPGRLLVSKCGVVSVGRRGGLSSVDSKGRVNRGRAQAWRWLNYSAGR